MSEMEKARKLGEMKNCGAAKSINGSVEGVEATQIFRIICQAPRVDCRMIHFLRIPRGSLLCLDLSCPGLLDYLYDHYHDRRVGQMCDITQLVLLSSHDLAENPAQDLPRAGFWQVFEDEDVFRRRERANPASNMPDQLFIELLLHE